jgi:hypothetical protein
VTPAYLVNGWTISVASSKLDPARTGRNGIIVSDQPLFREDAYQKILKRFLPDRYRMSSDVKSEKLFSAFGFDIVMHEYYPKCSTSTPPELTPKSRKGKPCKKPGSMKSLITRRFGAICVPMNA